MGFYFGKNNLRARIRKLVFGVRRLLATACVMHRVYRSRHFVSLRCLFLFFTMQSSPCCLFFYTTDSNGDYIAFAQFLRNL